MALTREFVNEQVHVVDYFNEHIASRNPHLGYFSSQANGTFSKIVCPFHDDVNPSLGIIPGTRVFNCFGCHAHGGVVEFHTRLMGVSIDQSIQSLAALYHLEEPSSPTSDNSSHARRERIQSLRGGLTPTQFARDFSHALGYGAPAMNDVLVKSLYHD